jgi:hypothetical protein
MNAALPLPLTEAERVCALSALAQRISLLTDTLPEDPSLRNPRTLWEIQNLESALSKIDAPTP